MTTETAPRGAIGAALSIAVVAISFAAIFFREAEPTHPLIAAGVRLVLSALLLLPMAIRSIRRERPSRRLVGAALIGGGAYALHFGTWVTSLTLTSVASSVTLVTATPVIVAIVGVVTGRDRPGRRLWVALGLSALGLCIVGLADFSTSTDALIGDALALGGAAAMAVYMLNARRLGRELDLWTFSTIATATGGVALLTTAALAGIPLEIAPRPLLFVALAALVPQMIGHNLLTWVLRHTTPTVVGIAVLGEPVGSAILGWIWLGEAVTWPVGLGCAVTLAGVAVAVTRRRLPVRDNDS